MNLPATPYLSVDLLAFDRNARVIADAVISRGGKRWRPHVKSMRAPELARRLLDAGASGVTVATLGEAALCVAGGIEDVMIANQVVGAAAMAKLAELNLHASVAVCVDSEAHVVALAEAATHTGRRLPLLIDVDVGMRRCGVQPGDDCVLLARRIAAEPALTLRGLMAWEGQATRLPPGADRDAEIRRAVGELTASAQACRAAGIPIEVVSCGGTGTFTLSSTLAGVTEIQAGGGAFGDRRARIDWLLEFEPALLLWSTVISRPNTRRVVCDAGWKSVAPFPTPAAPCGLQLCGPVQQSAEHASFELAHDDAQPRIGERLAWEVGYADSTLVLHDQLLAFDGDVEPQVWPLPRRRFG